MVMVIIIIVVVVVIIIIIIIVEIVELVGYTIDSIGIVLVDAGTELFECIVDFIDLFVCFDKIDRQLL